MKLFEKNWGLVLIIVISLVPLISLTHPGLPLTHDGQDHVARITNFYQSLSEGNIIPRWAGNLNWGYGHPILMFLYPLPSYAASLLHLIGFSFVDSIKVVFAGAFILSGVAMYLWLKEFLGEAPAAAGSILYNFASYRFVDLYVRGAIGEHVAFIFPPLILFCLLKMSKAPPPGRGDIHPGGVRSVWMIGGSLSVAGLLLSHNALAIMFAPFSIYYAAYLVWNSKKRKLLTINYSLLTTLGLGLSAFFLLPAFMEGKYTLRDIVTENVALTRFVELKNLISSPWNYGQSGEFSVALGLLTWISFLACPFVVYKLLKTKKDPLIFLGAVAFFVLSIFIMLPQSRFIWETITTLQKFQFPWRFLSLTVFTGAILGAFFVSLINNKKIQTSIVVIAVIFVLFTTYGSWEPKDYLLKQESFYSGIYNGTTDTGESSPIWSVRFMEKRADSESRVIAGSANIQILERTSTKHTYEITADFRSRILENTLYFPGWKVYIDGKENKGVQFQDPTYRGLMTYFVPTGKHRVDISFEDTLLRQISNYISLISLGVLGGLGILGLRKT